MEKTSTWVRIGKTADFPTGQKTPVTVNGKDILVYHDCKTWYAFERKCPHQGTSLDTAQLENNVIICPHHKISYNITTGEIVNDGGFLSLNNLKVFPVKLDGESVLVHPRQRTVDSWDRGLEM